MKIFHKLKYLFQRFMWRAFKNFIGYFIFYIPNVQKNFT